MIHTVAPRDQKTLLLLLHWIGKRAFTLRGGFPCWLGRLGCPPAKCPPIILPKIISYRLKENMTAWHHLEWTFSRSLLGTPTFLFCFLCNKDDATGRTCCIREVTIKGILLVSEDLSHHHLAQRKTLSSDWTLSLFNFKFVGDRCIQRRSCLPKSQTAKQAPFA